jgi:hypothetical protein
MFNNSYEQTRLTMLERPSVWYVDERYDLTAVSLQLRLFRVMSRVAVSLAAAPRDSVYMSAPHFYASDIHHFDNCNTPPMYLFGRNGVLDSHPSCP